MGQSAQETAKKRMKFTHIGTVFLVLVLISTMVLADDDMDYEALGRGHRGPHRGYKNRGPPKYDDKHDGYGGYGGYDGYRGYDGYNGYDGYDSYDYGPKRYGPPPPLPQVVVAPRPRAIATPFPAPVAAPIQAPFAAPVQAPVAAPVGVPAGVAWPFNTRTVGSTVGFGPWGPYGGSTNRFGPVVPGVAGVAGGLPAAGVAGIPGVAGPAGIGVGAPVLP